MKKIAVVLVLFACLAAVSASAQTGPVGGSWGFIGSAPCETPAPNTLVYCFTQTGKIQWSWNGAPYGDLFNGAGNLVTSVFGRTGAITPQAGDYSFSMITGQITALQLPATHICSFTLAGTTQDGKGNTSGTATLTACH